MRAAIVQVCVDERLNHELLRIQVRDKLTALYSGAERILILNEVAGNLGGNFRTTLDMLLKLQFQIVLAATLHHDDCLAAKHGLRRPMDETVSEMTDVLVQRGVSCVLATGNIYTNNNHIVWLDERKVGGQKTLNYGQTQNQ
jgi:hypothetical protein